MSEEVAARGLDRVVGRHGLAARRRDLKYRDETILIAVEAVEAVSKRRRLRTDEASDFRSWALVRLLEDDCKRLRSHRGDGSVRAYLRSVAENLLRDYRVEKWGKFRPSAIASRLGSAAVRLETLMHRDGDSPSEAIARLSHGKSGSVAAELWALFEQLPARRPRGREVSLEALGRLDGVLGARCPIEDGAIRQLIPRVEIALRNAFSHLSSDDLRLLDLHFVRGVPILEISRRFDERPGRLYRRMGALLGSLREHFEAEAVDKEQAMKVVEDPSFRFHLEEAIGASRGKGSNVARFVGAGAPSRWRSDGKTAASHGS